MYQALYRKWRPLQFADVIGQKHITDTLKTQITTGRLSHAYLFSGTRGTGKTTCAKILARAVNCENTHDGDPCGVCQSCKSILDGSILDVVEIDAASNNGVDNIRDIRDETRYAPASVKKRVYIIDEVHMLSMGAFNALLKTLEEPPSHVLFILATTEIHKVPATILSRCQRFDFRRITPDDIAIRLKEVANAENINLTDGGAKLIARLADGAMRDALSMLDRTAECEIVDENAVSRCIGILGSDDAVSLMHCIQFKDISGAVMRIGEAYDSGRELAGVFDQLLGLIRDMLLVKTSNGDVSEIISPAYSLQTVTELSQNIASSTLIAWSHILQESQSRLKYSANRRVEAELTIVRMCNMSSKEYDTLEGRVEALESTIKNGIATVNQTQEINNNAPKQEQKPIQQPVLKEEKPETKKKKEYQGKAWPNWSKLLNNLTGKINMGALTHMKAGYVKAEIDEDKLILICDDYITAGLLGSEPTKSKIRDLASEIEQTPLRLRIYEPDKQPIKKENNQNIDEILQKAQDLDIEITEL